MKSVPCCLLSMGQAAAVISVEEEKEEEETEEDERPLESLKPGARCNGLHLWCSRSG